MGTEGGSSEGKTLAIKRLCSESGQIVLTQREFLHCLQAESPFSQMRHESHSESPLPLVKGQVAQDLLLTVICLSPWPIIRRMKDVSVDILVNRRVKISGP